MLERFLAVALPLTAAALLFGGIAELRIKRSRGRLRGRWLAQLALILGIANLLSTMALPRFLIFREIGSQTRTLETLHRAEGRYRTLYPEAGYSSDLRALGPPPPNAPPSAKRAGLVDDSLSEGVYCAREDRLSYEPRAADDGTIVAYTVRLNSHRNTGLIDETGSIEFVVNPR